MSLNIKYLLEDLGWKIHKNEPFGNFWMKRGDYFLTITEEEAELIITKAKELEEE